MKVRKNNSVKSVLVATILWAGTADAVDRDWTGTTSTNWFTTSNWTPAGAPANIDDLDIGSGFTINAASTVYQGGLSDISIGASTVNMTGTSSGSLYSGTSIVDASWLRLNSGAILNTAVTYMGSSGVSNVNMSSSNWNTTGALLLGYSGTCNLLMSSSYINSSAYLYFGHNASGVFNGVVDSGEIRSTSTIYLGYNGSANLELNTNADLVSDSNIYMADLVGSVANVDVSGSYSRVVAGDNGIGSLFCGTMGAANLTVSDGADVLADSVYFGDYLGSSATASFTGTGTTLNSSGLIRCGYDGSAAVNVNDRAYVNADTWLEIGKYGVFNINHGIVRCGQISGTGTLNFNSGELHITSNLTLDGDSPLGSYVNFNEKHSLVVDGTLTVSQGVTARFNQATVSAGNLVNKSDIYVQSGGSVHASSTATNKGTVSINGGQFGGNVLSNNFGSMISGEGLIYSVNQISNYGTIASTGYLETNQSLNNYGILDVGAINYSFNSDYLIENYGNVNMKGSISVSDMNNRATGIISGSGFIEGATRNYGGQIYATGGSLTISNLYGNLSGGEVKVDNNAALRIMNSFRNDSLINLQGNGASLVVNSYIDNYGTIGGVGRISTYLNNYGGINAQNGNLQVSDLNNYSNGLIEVQDNAALIVAGGLKDNYGSIKLYGGKFDNNRNSLANAGYILGHGTMSGSVLTNNAGAYIGVGDGDLDIIADNFYQNGIVNVQNGSTVTFYGDVAGPGSFTGSGSVVFLADYAPGASPSLIAFGGDVATISSLTMELGGTVKGLEYDHLDITGEFAIGGLLEIKLINDFMPSYGDSFDLFDFGFISGEFADIVTPTLPGDLSFELGQLYTTGMVTVVPEPATLALLTGAALLATRRRK